jgi:hypothetical protein
VEHDLENGEESECDEEVPVCSVFGFMFLEVSSATYPTTNDDGIQGIPFLSQEEHVSNQGTLSGVSF